MQFLLHFLRANSEYEVVLAEPRVKMGVTWDSLAYNCTQRTMQGFCCYGRVSNV